ncbi:MAG: FAD-dependent oxidoreductase [Actinomycetota bacterium]|nr:FAD-dependent oxidoreductase [Actinomycetota bacterium]
MINNVQQQHSFEPNGESQFDLIVVGCGPAGAAAAATASRKGLKVLILERGSYVGAKNLYGGVIYLSILRELLEEAEIAKIPFERKIYRRTTMILDRDRAISLSVDNPSWTEGLPNAITSHRREFDGFLAKIAQDRGATLILEALVTDIEPGDRGKDAKVTVSNGDGSTEVISAKYVVVAEGSNPHLLEKISGKKGEAPVFSLGVKETISLDPTIIDERFGVDRTSGVDIEVLGATDDVAGGGFIYTNHGSISIGLVVDIDDLASKKRRPEDLLESFKSHPSIAPLIKGGTRLEYGAHLLNEAGYRNFPKSPIGRVVFAGDSASTLLAAGIYLEGVNYAIASGIEVARLIADTVLSNNFDELVTLASRISRSFIGINHKRLSGAFEFASSDFAQDKLPKLANYFADKVFTVNDPETKIGFAGALKFAMKEAKITRAEMARSLISGFRIFK